MGAHQTHPVNIEQICSLEHGDMGITLFMCSRAGSSGWGCAELQAIVRRNEDAKVKEEAGNDAGDICLLLEPSPAHCGGA